MPLINIMMDGNSATVDFQLRELFTALGVPEQYIRCESLRESHGPRNNNRFRIDPPLVKSTDALDDCSPANLQHLQEDLDAYLALPDTQAALDRTVNALINGSTTHDISKPHSC